MAAGERIYIGGSLEANGLYDSTEAGNVPASPNQSDGSVLLDSGWSPTTATTDLVLNGSGTWGESPEATTGYAGAIPQLTGSTNHYLRGDGNWAIPPDEGEQPPSVTTTVNGLCPPLTTDSSNNLHLRGDGTWKVPRMIAYQDYKIGTISSLLPGGIPRWSYDDGFDPDDLIVGDALAQGFTLANGYYYEIRCYLSIDDSSVGGNFTYSITSNTTKNSGIYSNRGFASKQTSNTEQTECPAIAMVDGGRTYYIMIEAVSESTTSSNTVRMRNDTLAYGESMLTIRAIGRE